MATTIKILLLEDEVVDAELSLTELKRAHIAYEVIRVDTEHEFRLQLTQFNADIIIADYMLPKFNGLLALEIAQQLKPEIPFIFLSGVMGEEIAIESLKKGAVDYVLKGQLYKLPNAIINAISLIKERNARKIAEKELAESHRLFQIFMEYLPGQAFIKHHLGHYVFANKATARALRAEQKNLIGHCDDAFLPADIASKLSHLDQQVLQTAAAASQVDLIPQQNEDHYWLSTKFPLLDANDKVEMIGGIAIDITEQRKSEQALILRDHAMEASAAPILIVDITQAHMPLIYVNSAFEKVTGYRRDEVIGRNYHFLLGDDFLQTELDKIRHAIRERCPTTAVLRNYRKDGSQFINELSVTPVKDSYSGQVNHYVWVLNDITQIKQYQHELELQANYDSLTGLANRNLLKERLRQLLIESQRYARHFTVVFIDIDNFKMVNDSLGHSAGDELISMIAKRIQQCVREGDTVARLGGDEFVVLLISQQKEETNLRSIKRLQREIAKPITIRNQELTITGSMGLARYPQDGEDIETLLVNADVAMYQAKASGRNTYKFYAKEMNEKTGARLSLENDLWHALENQEFFLEYQPQISLTTQQLVGIEALIRWQHPKFGIISPLDFIPMAESDGLIVPIGEWVLNTACKANYALQQEGFTPIRVAVNLSVRQLQDAHFSEIVKKALVNSALDPRYLELEITESMVMHQVEEMILILESLAKLGLQLSLDDFGTGYSSLAYLKRFPINSLKIDQSFISDVVTNQNAALISRSIIALAHAMQYRVIAEGVETAEQLLFLKENDCDEVQGYYLSKPVSIEEIRRMLSSTDFSNLAA